MLKWQEVLEDAQYTELTSSYIAREKDISLQHASVVLRRLWTWGLLRRRRDKDIDSPGQPHYYYEITNKGEKYLSWYREQPGQKMRTRQEVFMDEMDAFLNKSGVPKIEKTEKEKLHEDLLTLRDKVLPDAPVKKEEAPKSWFDYLYEKELAIWLKRRSI